MEKSLIDEKLKEIFLSYRNIAIVGASPDPKKDSNIVMKFLRNTGYKIFPVNPKTDEKIILGEKVYKSLLEIKEHIGIVNVFRPAAETPDIANEAKKIKTNVIWLQLNIHNSLAREIAIKNKIYFVSNKCTKIEYERLFKKI